MADLTRLRTAVWMQMPTGFQLEDRKKVIEVHESLLFRPLLRRESAFVCPLGENPHPGLNIRIDFEIYDAARRLCVEAEAQGIEDTADRQSFWCSAHALKCTTNNSPPGEANERPPNR